MEKNICSLDLLYTESRKKSTFQALSLGVYQWHGHAKT